MLHFISQKEFYHPMGILEQAAMMTDVDQPVILGARLLATEMTRDVRTASPDRILTSSKLLEQISK